MNIKEWLRGIPCTFGHRAPRAHVLDNGVHCTQCFACGQRYNYNLSELVGITLTERRHDVATNVLAGNGLLGRLRDRGLVDA